MLSYVRSGDRGPTLFLLHWLTGSAHTWAGFAEVLSARGVQCVAIDLPGFGNSNNIAGYDVQAMANAVVETISDLRAGTDDPWLLGGHSMGGKVAAAVAHEATNRPELGNLRGLFLLSPSPPSPEPMDETQRAELLEKLGESTGNVADDRRRAKNFVDENTGKLPLEDSIREKAIHDVLQMNRTAFRAWLEHGSKEDWSSRVGQLPFPALILAGSEEPALGPTAQRAKTLPHFTEAAVIELQGSGHLAPFERAFEVAEHACSFMAGLGLQLEARTSRLGTSFATLLESERVSTQTRSVMESRLSAAATWNYLPSFLDSGAFRTMRALADLVVPGAGFDVAASIEERLGSGNGDGWRFASLSQDAEAWRKGLASLDTAAQREFKVPFIALHAEQQNDLLHKAAAGDLGKGLLGTAHVGPGADSYSAGEMKLWFEEVRAEFTKCYMAHPATMEGVGFTGFADDPSGFTQIQLGQQEEFER